MNKKYKISSPKALKAFFVSHYMKIEGASNFNIAIRDCLTDLLHISDEVGIDLSDRLIDAQEVYEEEKDIKPKKYARLPKSVHQY